jgi:hypothetical protein
MNYDLKYRTGLIVQRNGRIDTISAEDLLNHYSLTSKCTFEPIRLNENTLQAFGFVKSLKRRKGSWDYIKYPILIKLRPLSNQYFCPNLHFSPTFLYLHELQTFYSFFDPFKQKDDILFLNFIANYGSRYLKFWDS